MKKVVFCVPTMTRPYQCMLDSLRDSIPAIVAAGWDEGMVNEIGCPYISAARATMLHKALKADADVVVFLDHDVSWEADALLKLIETEGHVVAGVYRFKKEEEEYMGSLFALPNGSPIVRQSDGAIKAETVPAGFLKITREAVNLFMERYPELLYGEQCRPAVDLFNHGAHERVWWGEDYAFSRRWREAGGNIWIVPDIELHHSGSDGQCFKGNFHQFMLRRPGGSEDPERGKEPT